MKQVPSGTELARPFMPAKDFELSKKFYETLGFKKVLDGDVDLQRRFRRLHTSARLSKKLG
jgi:hypothetical protein